VSVHKQRDFVLFVILAAAAVTPTWGQTVVPPAGSADHGQGAASIPDFSGIWGHPYLPGFEPPLSGPGSVVNKSRLRQVFGTDGPMAPGTNVLVTNIDKMVGDYTNPILKPQAAEAVKTFGEIELAGMAAPNPTNQCWPEPIPYILRSMGIQMLQQPDKITILYYANDKFRQIRLNEPHPARVTPSWKGDSVGHYEGDTLVIDTVGVKTDRPFAMVDWYGTPYTEALHVVERYRLLDYEEAKKAQERGGLENFRIPGAGEGWAPDPNYRGKGLQLQLTVEDEGAFTMPWSSTMTYRRPVATGWPEMICAENTHEYYAGKDTAVPRADKPDF
jgi:hypothetical protein